MKNLEGQEVYSMAAQSSVPAPDPNITEWRKMQTEKKIVQQIFNMFLPFY